MVLAIIANFFTRRDLLTTLNGQTGPIVSLDISPNGKFLASGGQDGVKIWEVETKKEVTVPLQPFQERSQVSCVRWITRKNENMDVLCYGNALGYLIFLQHRLGEGRFESIFSVRIARGGEILCITADTSNNSTTRIATGTRDKCIQVWLFDSSSRKLVSVHSKAYGADKDIVPKAIVFDDNDARDIYVFGLYDGGLYKYGGNDAGSLANHQLGPQIGHAAADIERKICVVDNVENGFDLYRMDTGNFVRTFLTRKATKTYPKGVAFADRSGLIIGGSDHGKVYVFERKTGRLVKRLKHAGSGGVEAIATHDKENGAVLIATASATVMWDRPNPILLWQWNSSRKASRDDPSTGWTLMNVLEIFLKLVMAMAAISYFVEKAKMTLHASSPPSSQGRWHWVSTEH